MAENEIKRVITIESSESLNTLNNLSSRIKELKENMGDLDITTDEYRKVSEEVTKLENVKRNAIRGVTAAVDGSYNAYSKELSILQKHRKTLNENTEEYKEMTKRVADLQQKLKDMDADVGVFSRNVGNYSSAFDGLQGSVNGVVKTLPSLNGGVAGFAQSMNEALPNLINSVKNYKEMASAAGKSTSALGALAKSLLSWQSVVSVAVTVAVVFAEEITEWVSSLFSAEQKIDKATEAIKKFNTSVRDSGLGVGEEIVKVRALQTAWNELGDSLDAKRKHIEENKSAFDELGIAINSVADAEKFYIEQTDDYIEALKHRAMAEAAKKAAGEYYEKAAVISLDEQKWKKIIEISEAQAKSFPGIWSSDQRNVESYRVAKINYGMIHAQVEKQNALGDALFNLALGYERAADEAYKFNSITSNGTSSFAQAKFKGFSNGKIPTITTSSDFGYESIVDASAEREALKATLDAKVRMTNANAEERKTIEEQLQQELATIEELRLVNHEIILNELLRDEELTAEERMAIEDELTKNKIAQSDLQLKAEEERAKKTKALKDKEVADEKTRKAQMKQISDTMASTTSSLLKQTAELLQENSKEQKALNAAAIAMDTYKAAMAGWTSAQSLPTPFNAIVGSANVAASVAMGATQLKNLFKVAPDGSNAEGALSSAQSAPNVASSMPASYTRSLQGDNELTEMNKDTRVYVVESDITNAQKSARVRVESASF